MLAIGDIMCQIFHLVAHSLVNDPTNPACFHYILYGNLILTDLSPPGNELDLFYSISILGFIFSGVDVEVGSCKLDFGKIPDKPYNYSDHEGVAARLLVQRKKGAQPQMIFLIKN